MWHVGDGAAYVILQQVGEALLNIVSHAPPGPDMATDQQVMTIRQVRDMRTAIRLQRIPFISTYRVFVPGELSFELPASIFCLRVYYTIGITGFLSDSSANVSADTPTAVRYDQTHLR